MRLLTVSAVFGAILTGAITASESRLHASRQISSRVSSSRNRGNKTLPRARSSILKHKRRRGPTERALWDESQLQHRDLINLHNLLGSNGNMIQVQLYWHVLHSGEGVTDGYLNASLITEQIAVVNSIFHASGLPMNINLASISYTNNAIWFEHGGDFGSLIHNDVIKLRRVGGAADINVFTVRTPREGTHRILGYGTMPEWFQYYPLQDAIFIAYDALPGFSSEGGELGHHLLGLEHTFNGGCSLENDGIQDTPTQGFATRGCEYNEQAQCTPGVPYVPHGDVPGATLTFNLMDWSNEFCKGGLTPGQVKAGLMNWYRYRATNMSVNGR
ncbi:BQ2448_7895 [Microbotryum intermedium]|uniref:BQ2448_7895 protein n=1 Tax=Microbotryum intermedium TaxID=269621 RepID=A0A238FUX9_9BASI|nr:BQ2448_7895 [Microbotryum intermedium]